METWKTIWRGISGLATLSAMALSAFGSVIYLLTEGRILFACATIAVMAFAFKPMWNYIQKSLM